MTLLKMFDNLVYATRLDKLTSMRMPPRSFRWAPLLVVAAMVVGFVLIAKAGRGISADFLAGWLVFYGAIVAAHFLRALGPRFIGTVTRPLDERELMVKARAHAASGVVLAMTFSIGCFYMTSAAVPWLWHPQVMDWFNLGFGIQGLHALLPTWIASWIEARPAADLDD